MQPRRNAHPPAVRRLRTAGPGGHTVYAVHPGALPVEVYHNLAGALPEGTGLTVLGLDGVAEYWEPALTGSMPDTTVEFLADRMRRELIEAHEGGPYSLMGWSFGGVVAHCMAPAMPRSCAPERLVLLDSIAPTPEYKQPDDALDPPLLLSWFAMYLGAKRERHIDLPDRRLAGRTAQEGLLAVLDAAVTAGALPPDTTMPGLSKLYRTYTDGLLRNNRLTAPYQAAAAAQPVVLIKAERSLIPGDPELGWKPLTPYGLDLRFCPGDHYTVLTRPDSATVIARQVLPAAAARPGARPLDRVPAI
jgi:thioesterase domain-containing protein